MCQVREKKVKLNHTSGVWHLRLSLASLECDLWENFVSFPQNCSRNIWCSRKKNDQVWKLLRFNHKKVKCQVLRTQGNCFTLYSFFHLSSSTETRNETNAFTKCEEYIRVCYVHEKFEIWPWGWLWSRAGNTSSSLCIINRALTYCRALRVKGKWHRWLCLIGFKQTKFKGLQRFTKPKWNSKYLCLCLGQRFCFVNSRINNNE